MGNSTSCRRERQGRGRDLQACKPSIARCVGIAVFYHNGEITAKMKAMMAAEYETVADRVKELGLSYEATGERILCPVEAELIARYGSEVGRRLNAEFLKAFEGMTVPIPCPALN